jgi:3-oxoacyl-[acyl-carrier-protein] synthase-3
MSSPVRVGIAGLGSYAPARVVPNSWFEQHLDTSDEWIQQRTGIRERRFVKEDEATSDLCIHAARQALEDAGMEATELDMIVVGTLTPDQFLPACAPLVQRALGARQAAAFDVNAACTGFLTAMNCGEAFIAAGRARHVLVIGAECLSRFLDMQDRTSCILFGDGAGAAVLRPWKECRRGEILRTSLGADGEGYEYIQMIGLGARRPANPQGLLAGEHFIRVRGREVYRFAVAQMEEIVREMLEGHALSEVGAIVPHQVNKRIIDSALERLAIAPERVVVNIDRYGNTSAASVPIALDEAYRSGRLEGGKLVVLAAFGAGLTWGGALLRW